MVQATTHTVTIDPNGLHNIVAIDWMTLVQGATEIDHDAKSQKCNIQSSLEHGATLTKFYVAESLIGEELQTTPTNDGPLPTAPKNRRRAERRGRGTPTSEEEKRQLTGYVVDLAINSKADSQCRLCSVQFYEQSLNKDAWEPAEQLPQQFIARYEQRLRNKQRKIRR